MVWYHLSIGVWGYIIAVPFCLPSCGHGGALLCAEFCNSRKLCLLQSEVLVRLHKLEYLYTLVYPVPGVLLCYRTIPAHIYNGGSLYHFCILPTTLLTPRLIAAVLE